MYRHLQSKHEECRVRAKLRAVVREGINADEWTHRVDSCRSSKASTNTLRDELKRKIEGQEEVRKAFPQYFAQLLGRSYTLDRGESLRDFLTSGPRLPARENECRERVITLFIG